jgi:hypothetical protein
MLTSKIFILILSLFITNITSSKILFHETIIVNSLTLTKEELTDLIIEKYQIKTDYNSINITSDYFYNPKYNQIYSITLEVNYPEEIIIYNLKLKAISENESSKINTTPVILILSSIALIVLIIYLHKRK